ncbi:ribosomal RNA small subunit methyltransferase I [Pullulanibacillus camelliae]|uniref:Ribosomal RNA small subunit methyltransferase I n=1 Tax=Pullulanibacillus camelliae TaxID=1707096 RepID=A0A8J3E0A9_9BACL|nr:16S rRNA (cytidine(1402)-2'-O)-methyltransferase [Pullulanibacillus camelliae]GGE53913.1 ribosomal RNA small subunit methyltransferase I [Pullulanibacillus camelliae]
MKEQVSFQGAKQGQLFLIPTPIGNLEDMSFRSIAILKEVDVIAAEDTRHTMKLCRHFDIQKPLFSYHEHNKKASGEKLIKAMLEGKSIGLVTDAGTPGISDPGADLVAACIEQEIKVIPLPGANAVLPALIASGLDTDHFLFYGFLPRQKKERTEALEGLRAFPYTLIFYEAPHRLKQTVEALKDVFGNRQVTLARELTKRYETFVRGSLDELLLWTAANEIKGECCLVVEGGIGQEDTENVWWASLSIIEHVNHYIKIKEMDKKQAIKQTAMDRERPKREVYNIYHESEA